MIGPSTKSMLMAIVHHPVSISREGHVVLQASSTELAHAAIHVIKRLLGQFRSERSCRCGLRSVSASIVRRKSDGDGLLAEPDKCGWPWQHYSSVALPCGAAEGLLRCTVCPTQAQAQQPPHLTMALRNSRTVPGFRSGLALRIAEPVNITQSRRRVAKNRHLFTRLSKNNTSWRSTDTAGECR